MKAGAEEFYLGGRRISGLVSAASYAATTYSAFMMLGLAGLTYRGGVGALGFELIYFAGLGLVVIFGPRYWLVGKAKGYVTPSEMLAGRYESKALGALVALLSCLFLIPYSAVQLQGMGLLMAGVSGGAISFHLAIGIGAVLVLAWTLVAGLRSVAWTDAVQVVVMLVSALLALGYVFSAVGGVAAFMDKIETDYPNWLNQPGPGFFSLTTFIALTLPWFFFSISNPQVSQRLFAVESPRALRTMIVGFLSFGLVFTLISVLWGFGALILSPGLESANQATPSLLASGAIPTGIVLLLVVGILAAAITTVDSIALTLASMVGRDVYRALTPGSAEARELFVGKIVVLVMVAAAALFASLDLGLIAVLAVTSSAGLLVMVPAIFGAFFWRRATAAGALASVLGGTVVIAASKLGGVAYWGLPDAVVAFAVTIALFLLVSLVTRPPADRGQPFIDDLRPDLDRMGML
jgi:SSS family solute:Na+ symporter